MRRIAFVRSRLGEDEEDDDNQSDVGLVVDTDLRIGFQGIY